jgi:hypothetical protein
MPLCPKRFFRKFSKNSDNFVDTDRTSEKFFVGSSNSKKAKMTVCMSGESPIRSKLLVLTPPRLQHEDLQVLL